MKKSKLLLFLPFLVAAIYSSAHVFAENEADPDANYPVEVSVSQTTAPADGESKITFYLFIYGYRCADQQTLQEDANCANGSISQEKIPVANRWVGVYSTGSGNIYTNLSTPAGVQYVTSDNEGKASFQMASTEAEAKKMQFSDHVWGVPPSWATSQTVTFTPLPEESEPTNEASNSRAGVPVLTRVEVNDRILDTADSISLSSGESITVVGTADPLATILLEISSESPQTATLNANSQGEWEYEFVDPAPGAYIVKAAATIPEAAQPSLQVTLLSFNVAEPVSSVDTNQDAKENAAGRLIWIVPLLLVLVIGCIYLVKTFRKRNKNQADKVTKSIGAQTPEVQKSEKDNLE